MGIPMTNICETCEKPFQWHRHRQNCVTCMPYRGGRSRNGFGSELERREIAEARAVAPEGSGPNFGLKVINSMIADPTV